MKIVPLNYISFTQQAPNQRANSIQMERISGMQTYTDSFVRTSLKEQQTSIVDNIAQKTIRKFENQWLTKAQNTKRYDTAINKTEFFNNLATSFYNEKEYEKAAISLAISINSVDKNPKFESDKLKFKQLIQNDKNLNILKDFYATSKNNNAKVYVMECLKNYNSEFFLPVAEDVLEGDIDELRYSDRLSSAKAREYLHNFYKFDLLKPALNGTTIQQNAALNIIAKWGTPNEITMIRELLAKEEKGEISIDYEIKNKAKHTIEILKDIGRNNDNFTSNTREKSPQITSTNLSFETLIKRIYMNSDNYLIKEIKKHKYPHGSHNATIAMNMLTRNNGSNENEIIKFIGQTGTLLSHLEFLKSDSNDYTENNLLKTEAYYMVLMRMNKRK